MNLHEAFVLTLIQELIPGILIESVVNSIVVDDYAYQGQSVPRSCLVVESRETEGGISLYASHAFTRRRCLSMKSSCYREAQTETHCTECTSIQPRT